jgi:hypothetical protein
MHFPHLSLVDDWLEDGMVMEVGSQPEKAPVSEGAIVEGTVWLGIVSTLIIFLHDAVIFITIVSFMTAKVMAAKTQMCTQIPVFSTTDCLSLCNMYFCIFYCVHKLARNCS